MTTAKNARTAALEALIEAHATELKLPTVGRRFRALADEATREQQTPTAYLAALLEAETAESAASGGASSTPASRYSNELKRWVWVAGGDGHLQRVLDEVGTHVAAVTVENEAEEPQAFPAPQVREIGDPPRIRAGRGEVALQHIRAIHGMRVRDRRAGRVTAALGSTDALTAHQALHLAARALLALTPQLKPCPAVPVRLVVRLMDLANLRDEPLIFDRPGRPLAGCSLVVRGRRYAQNPAAARPRSPACARR